VKLRQVAPWLPSVWRKSYGRRRVVDDVTLHVEPGEVVGLLGANGAGKTTTFYMIIGWRHRKPASSSERRRRNEVADVSARAARSRLSPARALDLSEDDCAENILAVLETTDYDGASRRKRVEELLQEFGIEHGAQHRGDSLSGGERRRTEIARALVLAYANWCGSRSAIV